MKKDNILVSITTTRGSDWRKKIQEVSSLGLRECALFLTMLSKDERKEFFGLLQESGVKHCPFVHLRSDMTAEDIEYLMKNYGTRAFNTHCQAEFPQINDWSRHSKKIYIENIYTAFDPDEMKNWAGICLDFSHLENDRRLEPKRYESYRKALEIYPIGCNHISAVSDNVRINSDKMKRFDSHRFIELSNFDYLKRYPKNYFSRYCALELENSLKEQLRAKDYIHDLLKS